MSASIACIVYKDSKVLIAHRKPVGDMGGRWEFPGGKLDAGDSDESAIIREMREEFGVKAIPKNKIASCYFEHKDKKCSLNAYMVDLEHNGIEKPYILTEHTEYKWVDPKIIPSLNFVDSDLKIYPSVMQYLESLK